MKPIEHFEHTIGFEDISNELEKADDILVRVIDLLNKYGL